MKAVVLNECQEWFLRCAIELKDAVLPLHPESLDDNIFEEDYGRTKAEVNKAIAGIKKQLNIGCPKIKKQKRSVASKDPQRTNDHLIKK